MKNINSVVITGNLTRDPKIRTTQGGNKVCNLRVAVNGVRKNGDEYEDQPNYFNVSVWNGQGEACAEFLRKGSGVAIEGRLHWSEETEGDKHREYVQIVANTVQFLDKKPEEEEKSSEEAEPEEEAQPKSEVEDDIPM